MYSQPPLQIYNNIFKLNIKKLWNAIKIFIKCAFYRQLIKINTFLLPYCRVKSGHYVATHGRDTPDPPYAHANRGYWTDGEESHRSERTLSEYTVRNLNGN